MSRMQNPQNDSYSEGLTAETERRYQDGHFEAMWERYAARILEYLHSDRTHVGFADIGMDVSAIYDEFWAACQAQTEATPHYLEHAA